MSGKLLSLALLELLPVELERPNVDVSDVAAVAQTFADVLATAENEGERWLFQLHLYRGSAEGTSAGRAQRCAHVERDERAGLGSGAGTGVEIMLEGVLPSADTMDTS